MKKMSQTFKGRLKALTMALFAVVASSVAVTSG